MQPSSYAQTPKRFWQQGDPVLEAVATIAFFFNLNL
jgi:hypothetical protein